MPVKGYAMKKADWTSLKTATREEIMRWEEADKSFAIKHTDRIIAHFKLMESTDIAEDGLPVSRYEHSLQTATRAYRDGRDEEYIVCALLHDIGDLLGVYNHQDIPAAILKPFISEQNLWMIEQHPLFQGYYFFHHMGADRHARDRFKDHPWYDYAVEFCEKYDQASFDANYDTLPFEHFEPMLRRILARPKWAEGLDGEVGGFQGQVVNTGAETM